MNDDVTALQRNEHTPLWRHSFIKPWRYGVLAYWSDNFTTLQR
jgi:hypothetical protein